MGLTTATAAVFIDPNNPPSIWTLRALHDRIGGPRDGANRRVFTPAVCDQIRAMREQSKEAQGLRGG